MRVKEKDAAEAMQKKESGFAALERNYEDRIGELEELLDFQEKEFEKSLSEADAKAKQASKALRQQAAPSERQWEKLSESGTRWARKMDVDFLLERLTEKEWRAADVATALHRAGMLEKVFDTSEVWTLRILWLKVVMQKLENEHWGPNLT
eukprot:2434596-Pleurochrysis_carterae.AAC.1